MSTLSYILPKQFFRASVWLGPCCRAPKLFTNHGDATEDQQVVNGRVCFLFGSSRTQLRYSGDYARFHRDLQTPSFKPYRKPVTVDVKKTHWMMADEKVGTSYLLGFIGWVGGLYATKSALTVFISSMAAAKDVMAMATMEFDVSKLLEGDCIVVKWRGKPVFIKRRTKNDIEKELNTPMSELRDPQTEEQRTSKPEWLICMAICTHLGCVPTPNSGDFPGGFYCACHGSHYDNLGRVRKGPAPLNLEVPPVTFLTDTTVLLG